MKRQTLGLCAAVLAAAGILAADATIAGPRIDPDKLRAQPKPALKPRPGVLKLPDCAAHFGKQPTGGKSYNCHFNFSAVCRNGTVLGPVNMQRLSGNRYRVTYSCYEPPH